MQFYFLRISFHGGESHKCGHDINIDARKACNAAQEGLWK